MTTAHLMVGKTVGEVNAAMADGPWKNSAPTQWCAWFASYIASAAGCPRMVWADEPWNTYPRYSTPKRGDFIYYDPPSTGEHVGIVYDVVNGVAQTIEGNTHGDPTHVNYYSRPWTTPVGFARPPWDSTSSTVSSTPQGVDVFTFLYAPSISWKFIMVPGMYVKNAPDNQADVLAAATSQSVYSVPDLTTLTYIMYDCGFGDQFGVAPQPLDAWSLLGKLGGGATLFTTPYKKINALSS